MEITPIAYFRSPFTSKFGIPRQSGLVENLRGHIVFCDEYRNVEALRGLSDFDYLWLIWGFSANVDAPKHPTVRPPRLGGNRRMGVFATRSPFRPNNLGLSSVKIEAVDTDSADAPVIVVSGADLMDGTPIYDIKPYLPFTDSHPQAAAGFVDSVQWHPLQVVYETPLPSTWEEEQRQALTEVLQQDPRPSYHHDAQRIYGMTFAHHNIRFTVDDKTLHVSEISPL